MKKLLLGAVAALMLTAGQASADGLFPSRSSQSSKLNWSGIYIGAGVGAGAVVHDISVVGGVVGFDGIGGEGVFGTVTVGADYMFGPGLVAGIFADYDFSGIESNLSVGPIDLSATVSQQYVWSIGGRLGFLVNPSTLVYGSAGYTQTEFEGSASIGGASGSASKTFDGYFVGAGMEAFLHQGWTLKLDYRFSQFGSGDLLADFGAPGVLEDEPSTHTARLTLNYRFGY